MTFLEPCGCWYLPSDPTNPFTNSSKRYLPQVAVRAHAAILSSTARTTLTQTFVNPTPDDIQDVRYIFPLYDGVSVVSFRCEVGGRVIHGVVKERQEAREKYEEAVKEGKKAALLEQSLSASDVFSTTIGKVPARDKAVVHITYLGELKHDAQADGIRFSIPSAIAPRYGNAAPIDQSVLPGHLTEIINHGKADITVDVEMAKESKIQTLQSPSHPVTMTLGRTSTASEDLFEPNFASATYTTQNLQFGKDFLLIVCATGQDVPSALLETHPDLPDQRAVMASLVPKFNLPTSNPEIIFIIDRSGSMDDKIQTLQSALRVFLKSLPVGVKFNICSFGSHYKFMWGKSQNYDASSLKKALKYVDSIQSDMGGTEMLQPVKAVVENRFKDMDTEVLLLTDGQIWDQDWLFDFINTSVADNPIRFFSLGIGDAASHSLIEGVARAGDGFAQSVSMNEALDKKVVRMLKGALTPHVKDYLLEIEYDGSDDDEYEIVEKSNEIPLSIRTKSTEKDEDKTDMDKKEPVSLFDPNYKEADIEKKTESSTATEFPELSPPKILQAPYKVPSLYSFNRTSVYLLLGPETNPRRPKSITLRGTSRHGPLTLTLPIEDDDDAGRKGTTIHQLAARKLMLELEEGRGWVYHAKDTEGQNIVETHESKKEDLVKREAVRLGVKFQVSGKWCSFVAVEEDKEDEEEKTHEEETRIAQTAPREEPPATMPTAQLCALRSTCPPAPQMSAMLGSSTYDPTIEDMSRSPVMKVAQRGERLDSNVFIEGNIEKARMRRRGVGKLASVFGSLSGGLSSGSGGGLFGGFGGKKSKKARRVQSQEAAMAPEPAESRDLQADEEESDDEDMGVGIFDDKPEAGPESENKVYALIAQQAFEGSWEWDDKVLGILGVSGADVEGKVDWVKMLGEDVSSKKKDDEKVRRMMMTLAVVAYLRVKCARDKETWELVADKAMAWVDGLVGDVGDERMGAVEGLFK